MRYKTPVLEDLKEVDLSTVIGALPTLQSRTPDAFLGLLLSKQVTADIVTAFEDEPLLEVLTSPRTYIFTYSKPAPPLDASVDTIEPSIYRLLDSPLRELASKVLEVISCEREKDIPIKSVGLTTFSDPDVEDGEEIVFKITLQCVADQALEYWDHLSNEVNTLRAALPLTEARLLDNKISINVEWE